MSNQIAARIAAKDIVRSFTKWDMAWFLAWEDIRQRYVRTMLGPLWIVLSTGIWFAVMGFVMANLFGQKLHDYLPFVMTGLLTWVLISGCITESTQVLVTSAPLITSFPIPIFTHYIRFILRNTVIFFHNILILLIVLAIFPPPLTIYTWLVIPGLLLNLLILMCMSICLSLTNLRYRDTHLAIASAMQVLPFVTPIYWDKTMLHNNTWIADFNPFYHMVEILRAPVLGRAPAELSWIVTCGMAAFFMLASFLMFIRYRHRIIFWL